MGGGVDSDSYRKPENPVNFHPRKNHAPSQIFPEKNKIIHILATIGKTADGTHNSP
jgi:hypothetical protein